MIRLKELREEKELTQEALGELINLTKANISKYESGKLEPNIETINFLASYFGVSSDYLLARTDVRNPEKELKEIDLLAEKVQFYWDGQRLSEEEMEDIRHDIQLGREVRRQYLEKQKKKK